MSDFIHSGVDKGFAKTAYLNEMLSVNLASLQGSNGILRKVRIVSSQMNSILMFNFYLKLPMQRIWLSCITVTLSNGILRRC